LFAQEPKEGFQLFTVNSKHDEKEENINFDLSSPENESESGTDLCYSLFDFNRIDLVEKFSTNFVLQAGVGIVDCNVNDVHSYR
jgi:hypothetical protein